MLNSEMCSACHNAGFRALKVVQRKSIAKGACSPWGTSPPHLLPLWEQSKLGWWAYLIQLPCRLMHFDFPFAFHCIVYACSV